MGKQIVTPRPDAPVPENVLELEAEGKDTLQLKAAMGRSKGLSQRKMYIFLGLLAYGATLQDACDYVGVKADHVKEAIRKKPNLASQFRQAIARGKMNLIQKIMKADSWKAAAWLLERRFPAEWGGTQRMQVTGLDGGPIRTEGSVEHSYAQFQEELALALSAVRGGPSVASDPVNGHEQPVHQAGSLPEAGGVPRAARNQGRLLRWSGGGRQSPVLIDPVTDALGLDDDGDGQGR